MTVGKFLHVEDLAGCRTARRLGRARRSRAWLKGSRRAPSGRTGTMKAKCAFLTPGSRSRSWSGIFRRAGPVDEPVIAARDGGPRPLRAKPDAQTQLPESRRGGPCPRARFRTRLLEHRHALHEQGERASPAGNAYRQLRGILCRVGVSMLPQGWGDWAIIFSRGRADAAGDGATPKERRIPEPEPRDRPHEAAGTRGWQGMAVAPRPASPAWRRFGEFVRLVGERGVRPVREASRPPGRHVGDSYSFALAGEPGGTVTVTVSGTAGTDVTVRRDDMHARSAPTGIRSEFHDLRYLLPDPFRGGLDVTVPEMGVAWRAANQFPTSRASMSAMGRPAKWGRICFLR